MASQNKILMLDDDQALLDLYQEVLKELPSKPEVIISNSGARAIALLEAERFTLLITDLRMPKMDGLQVLAIVRRKFPELRIIALTGIMDEEYRSRAYAMGVELFWQKPSSTEEMNLFKDCVESLLGREAAGLGFRGVQSKSLMDLIQMECLAQSSAVLRISQGAIEGKIWISSGDIVDASTSNMSGEDAFKEIFSWKGGNFEILPHEPDRPRTIETSYQNLLLTASQEIDEALTNHPATEATAEAAATPSSGLAALARFEGVEFVLTTTCDGKKAAESWGVENAGPVAEWVRDAYPRLRALGEKLEAGALDNVQATGLQRYVTMTGTPENALLYVGFKRTLEPEQVQQTMKLIFAKWAS